MELDLDTKITFGKYKDCTIRELFTNVHRRTVRVRISYFNWVKRKTQHTFTKEVEKYFSNIREYYDLGFGNLNQDYRPRTDLGEYPRDSDNPMCYIHN